MLNNFNCTRAPPSVSVKNSQIHPLSKTNVVNFLRIKERKIHVLPGRPVGDCDTTIGCTAVCGRTVEVAVDGTPTAELEEITVAGAEFTQEVDVTDVT